jgi:uncharacterized repeat protein (TIGR01451 family)
VRIRIVLGVLLSFTFASLAFAQLPVATFKVPKQDVLINDTFKFCVMFQNSGAAGYAPFIDLVLPRDPMNGNSPCDGISFLSATVTSTTPNVPLTPAPFAPSGCTAAVTNITHPFSPQVTVPTFLPAGQQLITMPLPFGSYQLSQPNILIEVTAQIHGFADANQPIRIYVRGGFRYGGSSSGSGIVQAAPVPSGTPVPPPGAWNTEIITPRVVIIDKQFLGKDNEMVPGPSMPQQYAISLHVAPTSHAVTGVTINDCLPPGGLWVVSGTPCMTQTWATLTGGSNTTITPTFTVGNTVGFPVCANSFKNTASITGGSWIPVDTNDTPPSLVSSGSSTITIRALAIQKSAQVLNAPQPLPGGQIAYRLNFEVSDYLRFGDIVISDTLTDGQTYVPNSGTLTVSDRFGALTVAPLDPFISPVVHNVSGNYVCPPPKDPCHPPIGLGGGVVPGGNRYTFNVSTAMIGHLPAAPAPLNLGVLSGAASTGPPTMTPAVGSIDFIVDITDAFSNQHGDDGKLSKDDPLYDDVQITGTKYSQFPALAPTPIIGAICIDHGSSCMAVPGDVLRKEVFAVNGVPVTSNPLVPYPVKRGDVVTFHLSKIIPSGDAEHLTVTDWFSQPVFDATPFTPGTVPICSNTVVPLPPGTTCYTAPPTVATPVLTVNASDNSVTFNFVPFNDTNNHPAPIDLYASVTVSTNPFPDGLLQTNEAEECETNSYGPTKFCQDAIAMVQLQEPNLLIRKTVYCAGGCNQPACGTSCPSPGVVTHATIPILGLPSGNADANDIVTFVVSLENIGSGPNGAYDVQVSDNIGAIPGTIVNGSFCVRRGDTTLLLSGTDYTLFASTTGWTLNLSNPPLGSIPSLNAATTVSGANIILIFFSVKLNPPSGVTVGGICPANTATLQRYSNMIGGQNFIGATGLPVVLPATATICTQLNPVKHIVSTSEADPINPNVTIGNLVRYELSVDVPEGTVPATTISDTLPTNLQIQGSATLATPGMSPQPPPLVAMNGIVQNTGTSNHPKFQIPAFVNAENDAACERLLITFDALVMNTVTNAAGQTKPNTFSVQIGNQPPITSPPVSVTIVEPKLKVTKDVVYTQTGTGHVALYTITIANISNATAFDVTIKETLPACVTLPTNPTLTAPIPAGVTLSGNFTNGFTLSPGLKAGEIATITFQVTVPPSCIECATLNNSVHVEWTSEPGPQGTGNATPGLSCTVNGERCGHGLPVNSYHFDASASICGKVCGVKFADLDGDGVRGPNDPPLAGWLINATGTSISTTTDANGHYCLDLVPKLPVGPYQICEATGVANWTPRTPTCVPATVTANTTNPQSFDFGNMPACSAKLCGRKTGPPPASLPLGGWTITASGNGPVVTATTQPDGSYCMILFGTGVYTITETPKPGWLQLLPTAGAYNVHVDCKNIGGVPVAVISDANGAVNPKVDFVNQNLCANPNFCAAGSHCEVGPNKTAICVSDINKTN